MGKHLLKLPKMGESVAEATLTKWLKEVGDTIEVDDVIVEIATDKVDSDVPSEVSGILIEKRFEENEIVQVGEAMAVIQTEGDIPIANPSPEAEVLKKKKKKKKKKEVQTSEPQLLNVPDPLPEFESISKSMAAAKALVTPLPTDNNNDFYSPLVKSIARAEGITGEELKQITGTGKDFRVTKKDILEYLENRDQVTDKIAEEEVAEQVPETDVITTPPPADIVIKEAKIKPVTANTKVQEGDQITEMSRMAKLTADHMIMSKQTSAHVQSFIEADLTNLWEWREKIKHEFIKREGVKLTFTPLFITALIKALKDFPLLNSSVQGDTIIQKKSINIGMATAMADGNLIVPVIKNADHLNLVGLARSVNDLAMRARNQQLKPDEVQDGTFTFTNIGNFGSLTGTPIINQPQVGIVAVGVIRKMPSVIETQQGDSIAIRKKVIISHSYDHRIINGAMGGQFIKNMTDYLENWDMQQHF